MSSGRYKGQCKHTYNVSLQLSYAISPVSTETEFTHNVTLLHSATKLLGILIPDVLIEVHSGSKNAIHNSVHLHTAESQRACVYFRFRPGFVYR